MNIINSIVRLVIALVILGGCWVIFTASNAIMIIKLGIEFTVYLWLTVIGITTLYYIYKFCRGLFKKE